MFEINSHSLFSKWFSESGKLVMKLFGKIKEVADSSKKSLVIVLIDEVESIAYARDCVSSNEPSDSLRVVNAVLTQLDQLRQYNNVLVLTTSNLTSNIDSAFFDRADLKQFVGYPTLEAIREIFLDSLEELRSKGIISSEDMDKELDSLHEHFCIICSKCVGLSGRTLRKLPLIAHALFVNKTQPTFSEFLNPMHCAVMKILSDASEMNLSQCRSVDRRSAEMK